MPAQYIFKNLSQHLKIRKFHIISIFGKMELWLQWAHVLRSLRMSLSPFTRDPNAPLWSPQPLNLSLQSSGLPRALGPMILFSFIFKNQSDHVPPALNPSPGPSQQVPAPWTGTCGSQGPGPAGHWVTQEHEPYLEGQGWQISKISLEKSRFVIF